MAPPPTPRQPEDRPRRERRFIVTRTQTVELLAESAEQAYGAGKLQLNYFGADTEDIEVEELEA